jgi:hypothetical protein
MNRIIKQILLILVVAGTVYAELITYPAPNGAPGNDDYTVQVREQGGQWQDLFCYGVTVGSRVPGGGGPTSYVYFDADFSGPIEMQVTMDGDEVSSVKIRPTSYGVVPEQNDNTVSFTLERPRKLSIEFNDDIYANLQVFANSLEADPPDQGDPGVTYYGPGVHNAGVINLSEGQALYIAGGAYVNANVTVRDTRDVRILGRGILSQGESRNAISISNSDNVTVDGIIVINERDTWTVVPRNSSNVIINNFKLISHLIWSDGIDPVSCQHLTISDVYLRSGDDCISIKASGSNPNTDILVKNAILWGDGAHAVLIGPEGDGALTSDITFDSIEVLEVNCPPGPEWWGVVGMTCSGNVTMRDITYSNFNIDDFTLSEIFNLRIESNQYVSTPGRAIRNIKYINWSYTGPNSNANLIKGYDASRAIDSIYFINLKINGELVLSVEEANCTIEPFASNIFFLEDSAYITPLLEPPLRALAPYSQGLLYFNRPGDAELPAPNARIYSLLGRAVAPAGPRRFGTGFFILKGFHQK